MEFLFLFYIMQPIIAIYSNLESWNELTDWLQGQSSDITSDDCIQSIFWKEHGLFI